MENEKRENVLNLSLAVPVEEREKSEVLRTGFDFEESRWEVIIKYNGDILQYEDEEIKIEVLINGYAIVNLPERRIEEFTGHSEVEYMEKPKAFFANGYAENEASCILPVKSGENGLTGEGVLLAVIDSGIDYFRKDFQNESGSRILYLWDQTLTDTGNSLGRTPEGFYEGLEFTKDEINRALQAGSREAGLRLVPQQDRSGHGTAVAGIAGGSAETLLHRGVANGAEFIIVKLKAADTSGFPGTCELMRGITYAIRKAQELKRPLVINLSYGNSYGSHDGTSLLERFLDNAAEINRSVICVGSGNEGNAGGHAMGSFLKDTEVELTIGLYETGTNVQLWKHYADEAELRLISPGGETYLIEQNTGEANTIETEYGRVLIFSGTPLPYSVNQEMFFAFIPNETYLESGIWKFVFTPRKVANGVYHMYLPGSSARNEGTRFTVSNPDITLTIPSTAKKVITVGAYNRELQAYADFSGRGYPFEGNQVYIENGQKPDLVAPGVDIMAPSVGEGYRPVTGTSFATPIVAGSCALLMEWGIIKGNDAFLYGEKVKAYLQKGAEQMKGYAVYPNQYVGWGALCVQNSF